ncbi:MAG: cytochrome c oxidase subunit 3 [Sphingobacteriaceae bacterium]|nr:cytochrome c oxidase subunit 3 [Sphingobacteriaceae bacterium]
MEKELSELSFINTPSAKAKRFVVWLFVASSTIMFGGFTSYYIIFSASKGKGHGLVLPDAFLFSTVILILSSLCLFLAKRLVKQSNLSYQKVLLILTFVLGIVFGYMQFMAWGSLYRTGATLINNNAAISFIYVVSALHLLHIVGGLGVILNCIFGAFKPVSQDKLMFRLQIASIFWHFIDILWIYLYVFLLLNS